MLDRSQIWATAVKSKLRSAVLMWPGPPELASGVSPTRFYPFINESSYEDKVDRVAKWLGASVLLLFLPLLLARLMPRAESPLLDDADLDFQHRPHFMAVYAPEVDQEGHRHGPESAVVSQTLADVDNFVRQLFDEVDRRNLSDVVDVVVVSDHGMADTSMDRLIFLDDVLGAEGFAAIERNEGWPCAGLRFAPGTDEKALVERLRDAASRSGSGFECYTSETMPERWHFTGHEVRRSASLLLLLERVRRSLSRIRLTLAFLSLAAHRARLLRARRRLGPHEPPRARRRHAGRVLGQGVRSRPPSSRGPSERTS